MKFIKLTSKFNSVPVYVNATRINSFWQNDSRTTIVHAFDDKVFTYDGTVAQLLEDLNDETNH